MGHSQTYTDQFFTFDPWHPPAAGTAVEVVNLDLTDKNGDGDFDRNNNDSVDGKDIVNSYAGDTVTIDVPGVGHVTYTGVTFYLSDGRQVFTPNDGQALQSGKLVSTTWVSDEGPLYASQLGPVCFTPGTRIATPLGARDIADLRVGDLVVTRDHGLQPIRWIESRTVPAMDKFAPIRIRPGVVTGQDRDLLVSPQHRMLFQGYRAELLFGESEVLVAAKHLVDGVDVTQDAGGDVTYIHMMFDEHEIVFAEGAATESFHPGDIGLNAVHDAAREELFALFPSLRADVNGYGPTARRCLKRHEAELLRV